jgi:hypothetical protein
LRRFKNLNTTNNEITNYIFFLLCTDLFFAQETTGILKGNIFDEQNNHSICYYFIVQKIYRIKYTTQSQADGYYEFNHCNQLMIMKRVLRSKDLDHLFWMLFSSIGKTQTRFLPFLKVQELAGVEVNNSTTKGNEKRLKIDVINSLPSANRSIQDAVCFLKLI